MKSAAMPHICDDNNTGTAPFTVTAVYEHSSFVTTCNTVYQETTKLLNFSLISDGKNVFFIHDIVETSRVL